MLLSHIYLRESAIFFFFKKKEILTSSLFRVRYLLPCVWIKKTKKNSTDLTLHFKSFNAGTFDKKL
jgi:hypothetical protein